MTVKSRHGYANKPIFELNQGRPNQEFRKKICKAQTTIGSCRAFTLWNCVGCNCGFRVVDCNCDQYTSLPGTLNLKLFVKIDT